MFKVVDTLDKATYCPRMYVAAVTDRLAATKVQQNEQRWAEQGCAQGCNRDYDQSDAAPVAALQLIPRSREVGQSWLTSACTTAWATLFSVRVICAARPQLLLANGPGTCLPLCLLASGMRLIGLLNCKVVFVESIARTRKLSMTGQILYKLRAADELFVQWEDMKELYPNTTYRGRVY